jgi:hypothetical protein
MTDPIRLRDPRSGATTQLRGLLAAGRSEMPDTKRLRSIACGLGLVPAIAPSGVGALAHVGSKWLSAGVLKIGATVLLVGVGASVFAARSHPVPATDERLTTSVTSVRPQSTPLGSTDVPQVPEQVAIVVSTVSATRPIRSGGGRSGSAATSEIVSKTAIGASTTGATPANEPAASHQAQGSVPSTWGSAAPAPADRAGAAVEASVALDLALRDERSSGGLVEDRDVAIIEALVHLGRMGEARQRAARFFRVFPGSARRRQVAELVGFDLGTQNP